MKMITQSELKELFEYNLETGIFTWKKPLSNRVKINSKAGTFTHDKYLEVKIKSIRYRLHRLAWLYVYGEFPNFQIDHINHIKTDNSIKNLRNVSNLENGRNQSLSIKNKTGFSGVVWNNKCKKYQVQIRINGNQKYLGLFENLDDAIICRSNANKKYGFHENHGLKLPKYC